MFGSYCHDHGLIFVSFYLPFKSPFLVPFEFWFYSYFWGDFGIDCRMVLCHVFGMFCGINLEDTVAGGQGLFRDGFGSKLACTRAAKELSSTLVRGWA